MSHTVDVPDNLFALPKGVEFSDVPAAELMATPRPAQDGDTLPAPQREPMNRVKKPHRVTSFLQCNGRKPAIC